MQKNIVDFISEQIRQTRKGGLLVLFRKLYKIPLILFAVPLVMLVRLLRPLVVIRFGPLMSSRIGHFAGNTEVYLCERDKGMHGRHIVDIFYHTPPVCNRQLKKMWNRTIRTLSFASLLHTVNHFIPGGTGHGVKWRDDQYHDIHGLLECSKPHLSFTPEEERRGFEALRQLGIPEDTPFICFYARDALYLDAFLGSQNWRYHDYRDCNIHNYIPAAEEMARRGYPMVRMGAVVREAINTSNPRIIDYAKYGRTDFLDIFLSAKCRFFISPGGGLDAIAMVFRRPIAFVNFIPAINMHIWNPKVLCIPKKLWLRNEKRFLTFREIINSKIGGFMDSRHYEESGIEAIENTPEEIFDLVIEMDERLKGTWQSSKEDELLQQRFWSLFKSNRLEEKIKCRIGAEFLRKNSELLN